MFESSEGGQVMLEIVEEYVDQLHVGEFYGQR